MQIKGILCKDFKKSIYENDNNPVYFRGYNENDETEGFWNFDEQALGISNISLNKRYLVFEIRPFPSDVRERFNWNKKAISSKELLDRIVNVPDDTIVVVKAPGRKIVPLSYYYPALIGSHEVYLLGYCTTEYLEDK